jgi:hypothetical protein
MKWATRRRCHVDRAACAWLISRFIDPEPEFVFVDDPDEIPADATGFDIRGVELTHKELDCSFETILKRYALDDAGLWAIARIVHEADLGDELFDAPEAPGLDAIMRGLAYICGDDQELLAAAAPLFDGLYERARRGALVGN